MARVELKYEPGIMFPWRVVHEGTNECVQVYGESMAYKAEYEARGAILREGHELIE